MSFQKSLILFVFLYNSYCIAQKNNQLSLPEIDSLATARLVAQDFQNAIPLLLLAREKTQELVGKIDTTSFSYTEYLISAYCNLGEYQQAEKEGLFAKELALKFYGKESIQYAETIDILAVNYSRLGQFEKAEKMAIEAINLYSKLIGKQNVTYARGLYGLAQTYISQGKFEEAQKFLLEQKDIAAKIFSNKKDTENTVFFAFACIDLADLYNFTNQFEQAEPLYLQAKTLYAEAFGEQSPFYGVVLNGLATVYEQLGQLEKAEYYFSHAVELQKLFGKNSRGYLSACSNLARVFAANNQLEKAEKTQLEAVNTLKNYFGTNHPDYGTLLTDLGNIYVTTQNYTAAEKVLTEAQKFHLQLFGNTNIAYSASAFHLANLYNKMGKKAETLAKIQETIYSINHTSFGFPVRKTWIDSVLAMPSLPADKFRIFVTILDITCSLLEKNNASNKREQQQLLADLVLNLIKKNRDKLLGNQDKMRMLELSNKWMQYSLKILNLDTQQEKAFDIAEHNKSVLVLEATKSERNFQLGELPDSYIKEQKQLLKQKESIQATLSDKRTKALEDSLLAVLNNTNISLEAWQKKVEKEYPKYAKLQQQETAVQVKAIQALLDDKTALIEYVLSDSFTYVFYIDKQTIKVQKIVLSSKTIDLNAKELHTTLSNYALIKKASLSLYEKYTATAYWFYENLLAPVLDSTKNHLIIVPDGSLAHLPFEAFLTSAAPRNNTSDYTKLNYLIHQYKISYNYSAMLFAESQQSVVGHSKNGLIYGIAANYAPSFNSKGQEIRLPTYFEKRSSLSPLPAARMEVEALAQDFQGLFAFDLMATEKEFKNNASNYSIIHLAMHGLLNKKSPILSSLAFTEDGDSLENNFLQAYEISKMELNADLVVLSACETGYGKFEIGNGTASLARAFMYAGIPSLVVSLWQVNDGSTSTIMKLFYKNLSDNMDKAEALRQAKLDYLKNAKGIMAHPAFWSAFIQIGNTKAIPILKKNNYWWWAIGGGILVLVATLAVRKRKK